MGNEPTAPPAVPVVSPADAAQQFMRENYEAYRRGDAAVVREVRTRFAQAHPGVEQDGVSVGAYDDAPPAPKPAEKSAERPTPPAKLATSQEQVPSTPSGYAFPIPDPPPGETWAPTLWPTIREAVHAAGLDQRQAESWASFLAGNVIPAAIEGGADAVINEKYLGAAAQRLKALGVPDAKAKTLLERSVERIIALEPRAPVDTSALETRQRELMMLPEYRDTFHPRHAATKAEIHRLAEEIVRRKPILLQD